MEVALTLHWTLQTGGGERRDDQDQHNQLGEVFPCTGTNTRP